MAATEEKATEPPRSWVEQFYDSESEVRGVLDDTRGAHLLGEYETVREQLRAFGQAEKGLFRAIALIVIDVESFYEDVADQYERRLPEPPLVSPDWALCCAFFPKLLYRD